MVQNNCRLFANQNSLRTSTFNIIFWNAGGMTDCKLLEFENNVCQHNPDLFAIVDSGSLSEQDEKLKNHFKNYQIKTKSHDRKLSSGMIIGIRRELSCTYKIIKKMNNQDTMEAISIIVYKNKETFPCTVIYNPPKNIGNFDLMPIENDCLIFCDFNSPSTRWNHSNTTPAGKNLEDFIDTTPVDRISSNTSSKLTQIFFLLIKISVSLSHKAL